MAFEGDYQSWALVGGAGFLGRLMYHAKLVQAGKRKPFSWVLLWDIPIALALGWIALGFGVWLHAQWEVIISMALIAAYLGPYGVDTVFAKWAEWRFTGKA